ncbi:MAG: DUF4421 domain-containing protein [Bacteroidia bacterium]|jgi:hypothetical protein|nr:DUF4421 domain-containing protein [Bacteroidia bacterium]
MFLVRLILSILLVVNLTICCLAQQPDSTTKNYLRLRGNYVYDLSHRINVTALGVASGNGLELRSTQNIRYRPNETGKIGLRISHQWLSIGFSAGITNLQSSKRGRTEFFDLVANSYGRKWGFDLYYLTFKGHYITNKEIVDLPQFIQNNSYPILPDLKTTYAGINAYYIFNHLKYSYRATFIRNEIQRKSAGSFLLMASFSYFKLNTDSGIVPFDLRSTIPNQAQLQDGVFNSISLMPGYAYTFVFKERYFLTLSPSIGIMSQLQSYTTADNTLVESKSGGTVFYPRGLARAGIGYNNPNWYCGISAIVDNYIIRLPGQNQLIYNIGNAHLYIGYRFNVPKKYRRYEDLINQYAPEKIVDDIIR